jgi:hypothetical protein
MDTESRRRHRVRAAVLGIVVLVSVCATCIIGDSRQQSTVSSNQSSIKSNSGPSTPGIDFLCYKPTENRSQGASTPVDTNVPEHVVAYGVLADGTEVSIYGTADKPKVSGPSNYVQSDGPTTRSPYWSPSSSSHSPRAENGSYYGQISENTGRPKTVHVRGYYRNDGTYVRSHYRSRPHK